MFPKLFQVIFSFWDIFWDIFWTRQVLAEIIATQLDKVRAQDP